ncbi:MAG: hypothetical protein ACE5I1_11635, partial [bacterium]
MKSIIIKCAIIIYCISGFFFPASDVAAQAVQSAKFKFYGEYGLYIQDHEDSLFVFWTTVETDSGYLRVSDDG